MSDAPFKAPRNEDAMRCLGISEKAGLLAEEMAGRIAEAQCTYEMCIRDRARTSRSFIPSKYRASFLMQT